MVKAPHPQILLEWRDYRIVRVPGRENPVFERRVTDAMGYDAWITIEHTNEKSYALDQLRYALAKIEVRILSEV